MRKGVNVIDINFSSIQSELLQDNKNANSKHTTSPPMLTMGSFNPMNHSDFQASRYENLGMRFLIYGTGKVEYLLFRHCFNLSHRVLTETGIKCFNYEPIQKKMNNSELKNLSGIFGIKKPRSLVRYHVLNLNFRGNLLLAIQRSNYFCVKQRKIYLKSVRNNSILFVTLTARNV